MCFQEPDRQTAFSIPTWPTDQSVHARAQVKDDLLCCRRESSHVRGREALRHSSQQIRSSFLWLFTVKISLRADLRCFPTEAWDWRRHQLMFKSTENADVGPNLPQSLSGWKWGQGLIDRKFLNCIMLVEIVKQTVCDWASASFHSCPQRGHQACSFHQVIYLFICRHVYIVLCFSSTHYPIMLYLWCRWSF